MKQFVDVIPGPGIRIQWSFLFFFLIRFNPLTVSFQPGKTLFNLVLNISFSSWLVLIIPPQKKKNQISCWISSTVLLLQNVVRNFFSQSQLWCAIFFFLQREYNSWLFYNVYLLSLEQSSLTESISRFSTRLDVQVLAKWSKHCLAKWPLDVFQIASRLNSNWFQRRNKKSWLAQATRFYIHLRGSNGPTLK